MIDTLLVGAGGFVGAVLRYWVSVVMIGAHLGNSGALPWGTLTVNVVGSLLAGFFVAVTGGERWYYLAVVGFCGGFTTFSTLSVELLNMAKCGNYAMAGVYVAVSILLCVLSVWCGMYAAAKIVG